MSSDTSNFLISEAQLILDAARKEKAIRTQNLGDPIQLTGKALAIQVRDGTAWIAENTAVARKIDLETGITLQLYRGHTGPVTCLAFCDKVFRSGDGKILITGSWDQKIILWDTDSKEFISATPAHTDFVKALFVISSLQLLVSGSSDKVVRFWDLSTAAEGKPLACVGSISSHTRPVECLGGKALSENSAILYTADTMGVIKAWDLQKEDTLPLRWRSTLKEELKHHRTRINEMLYGNTQLWTASSDETVQVIPDPLTSPSEPSNSKLPPPITHPVAVRAVLPLLLTDLAEPYLITGAGDIIRVYDVSSPAEPDLIGEIDAHWHDVTALRLWVRKFTSEDGKTRVEPWIISAALDGTIRKWKLNDLVNPPPSDPIKEEKAVPPPPPESDEKFKMSEEEERELAEMLDSE